MQVRVLVFVTMAGSRRFGKINLRSLWTRFRVAVGGSPGLILA